MSGIVFLGTTMLEELTSFYIDQVGCRPWLEQADCTLFRHGNFIFGLCRRDTADTGGILTFFYESRDRVDRMYDRFASIAVTKPAENAKYRIYQFFARDPEGRMLEFQYFDHPVDSHFMGDELLLTRRSIRKFEDTPVPPEVLDRILEVCRYAPTSMNTQSYYFKLIRDRALLEQLAHVRKNGGQPIANAPMAVAVCSDPALSRRHIQDGCIAAYHFLLAAWCFGLGTCWIAAMDRDSVKDMLNIPQDHYVATITPLGFPRNRDMKPPERKDASWFIDRPRR